MHHLASVWEEFRDRFRAPPTRVEPTEQEQAEDEARRRSEISDCRVFIGCDAYSRYRKSIESEMKSLSPDPRLGIEAAACMAFKREGLQRALDLLDHILRLAQEKLADD